MNVGEASSWLEVGMSAGPLWVVFGIVIFFLLRYVPQLVSRHLKLMDQVIQTQVKICESLEALKDRLAGRIAQ